MNDRPALSKGEMDIARVLWDIGPASVRQVHEVLSETLEIDITTVQTYLRRLEEKGYASSRRDGRARIYSARTKRRTVVRETVSELVQRLFAGKTMPLVRHLIEDHELDSDDLDELRALIDQLNQGDRS